MIILHFDLQPQFKYMIYFIYTLHQKYCRSCEETLSANKKPKFYSMFKTETKYSEFINHIQI